jgi:hypothetical protein
MAETKTQATGKSVDKFIDSLDDERKRNDSRTLVALMEKATKAKAEMWGENIIGCGRYLYKYANGREAQWPLAGFSPRKRYITLYLEAEFDQRDELLAKLGKHTTSKVCVYVKSLEGLHMPTLKKLVAESVKQTKKIHPIP